jgi:hypothetical protein
MTKRKKLTEEEKTQSRLRTQPSLLASKYVKGQLGHLDPQGEQKRITNKQSQTDTKSVRIAELTQFFRPTIKDLFELIEDNEYSSEAELLETIRGLYNEHLARFNPSYPPEQLIRWAYGQGWIKISDQGTLSIRIAITTSSSLGDINALLSAGDAEREHASVPIRASRKYKQRAGME